MSLELPQPEPDPWSRGDYGPFAGPLPPDVADVFTAREAPFEPGLSDAEFDRLHAERIQTEIAYKEASGRERLRELEAEAEWEMEL